MLEGRVLRWHLLSLRENIPKLRCRGRRALRCVLLLRMLVRAASPGHRLARHATAASLAPSWSPHPTAIDLPFPLQHEWSFLTLEQCPARIGGVLLLICAALGIGAYFLAKQNKGDKDSDKERLCGESLCWHLSLCLRPGDAAGCKRR